MKEYDIIIIGGGIIGCAISKSIISKTKKKVAVLEKENHVGEHASSRNSGVIHSGFYYKPNSLKARFCVEGNKKLLEYCLLNNVPYKKTGTLVVAKNEHDSETLYKLLDRGKINNVPGIKIVNNDELRKIEPYVKGKKGLYSPTGSIVNSKILVKTMAAETKNNGVDFLFGEEVLKISQKNDQILVNTKNYKIKSKYLINCAGIYADRIANLTGLKLNYRIIPFRGKYYQLIKEKSFLLKSMVYPIPDPNLPFLGIHITRTIDNNIIVGPNAVLAFGREAYSNKQFSISDIKDIISYDGFWKMMLLNSVKMKNEFIQSFSKGKFVEQAQNLIPNLKSADFQEGYSGIRAQLVDRDGKLVDDLIIKNQNNITHILNAVSPGMTCSLPFADYVVNNYVKNSISN
jgi:L-2-hydroxyglutarate oxidase